MLVNFVSIINFVAILRNLILVYKVTHVAQELLLFLHTNVFWRINNRYDLSLLLEELFLILSLNSLIWLSFCPVFCDRMCVLCKKRNIGMQHALIL